MFAQQQTRLAPAASRRRRTGQLPGGFSGLEPSRSQQNWDRFSPNQGVLLDPSVVAPVKNLSCSSENYKKAPQHWWGLLEERMTCLLLFRQPPLGSHLFPGGCTNVAANPPRLDATRSPKPQKEFLTSASGPNEQGSWCVSKVKPASHRKGKHQETH